jgi:hypothetical protein
MLPPFRTYAYLGLAIILLLAATYVVPSQITPEFVFSPGITDVDSKRLTGVQIRESLQKIIDNRAEFFNHKDKDLLKMRKGVLSEPLKFQETSWGEKGQKVLCVAGAVGVVSVFIFSADVGTLSCFVLPDKIGDKCDKDLEWAELDAKLSKFKEVFAAGGSDYSEVLNYLKTWDKCLPVKGKPPVGRQPAQPASTGSIQVEWSPGHDKATIDGVIKEIDEKVQKPAGYEGENQLYVTRPPPPPPPPPEQPSQTPTQPSSQPTATPRTTP